MSEPEQVLVDCPRCAFMAEAVERGAFGCVLCEVGEKRISKVPQAMAVEYALHLGKSINIASARTSVWFAWCDQVAKLRERHGYPPEQWMEDVRVCMKQS